MQVKDENLWRKFLADCAADPSPLAGLLQNLTVDWAEGAERLLREEWGERFSNLEERPSSSGGMFALRETLRPVVLRAWAENQVRLSIGMIGAALVLLSAHWVYGENLYIYGNDIERHLMEDATLVKMAQLDQEAQEAQQ